MGKHPFLKQVSDISFLIYYYTLITRDFKHIFTFSKNSVKFFTSPSILVYTICDAIALAPHIINVAKCIF